jgi:hypothetical protein
MTRDEFVAWTAQSGIEADCFSLDGGHPSEAFVLDRRGSAWVVYYSERGLETAGRTFGSERQALDYLSACLAGAIAEQRLGLD